MGRAKGDGRAIIKGGLKFVCGEGAKFKFSRSAEYEFGSFRTFCNFTLRGVFLHVPNLVSLAIVNTFMT